MAEPSSDTIAEAVLAGETWAQRVARLYREQEEETRHLAYIEGQKKHQRLGDKEYLTALRLTDSIALRVTEIATAERAMRREQAQHQGTHGKAFFDERCPAIAAEVEALLHAMSAVRQRAARLARALDEQAAPLAECRTPSGQPAFRDLKPGSEQVQAAVGTVHNGAWTQAVCNGLLPVISEEAVETARANVPGCIPFS